MGTRSLTVFVNKWDDDEEEICVMYRQFDGYPEGHGKELCELLSKGKMVNGISMGDNSFVFNGMGCLAAQVVAHFKEDAGGFYLHAAGTRDCGEEYIYTVSGSIGEEPHVTVYSEYDGELFAGTASEVLELIEKSEGE